jgi:type I restriction enzyme M protein
VLNSRTSVLDKAFDELLDQVRSFTHATVFRQLLALFALKFICDTGAPWDKTSRGIPTQRSWDDIDKEFVTPPRTKAELLLEIANEVEVRHECLDGVFTRGLLSGLSSFPREVLSHIILRLARISTVGLLADIPFPFGQWFNAKMDSLVMTSESENSTTLPSVADLMVGLVDLSSTVTIFDPCCGIGTILARAAKEGTADSNEKQLYGQEIHVFDWSLCKLRLFVLGCNVSNIINGDAFHAPAFKTKGDLEQFDRVFCDSPIGMPFRDRDFSQSQIQFTFGKPGSLEGAFMQLVTSSLKSDGKAVVVVSHGFLFRSGADARVRKALIESGKIQTVIGLPRRTRPNTVIETALILLQHSSSPQGVSFIDASNLQPSRRGRAELTNKTIQTIIELTLNSMKKQSEINRFATLDEIRSSGYSLLPRRYIYGTSESLRELGAIQAELFSIEREYHHTIQEMDSLLRKIHMK